MKKAALMIAAGVVGMSLQIGASRANPPPGAAATLPSSAPATPVVPVQAQPRQLRMVCLRGKEGWRYFNLKGERIACPPRPRSAFVSWRCTRQKCGWYHRGQKRFL